MIDLKKGSTLIEASAGTGKTYTLCRIALQLTLQHGITLDRILAVTFTEAATEELAARIHSLYQDCLEQLNTGVLEEELLKELAAQEEFDPEQAKQALRYSLEVFDEAPISTIHGFCKRSLEQVALETKTPLDAELGQVENEMVEQLQNEYLRQFIVESSPALCFGLSLNKEFDKLLREIGRQTASHPQATLRPQPIPLSIENLDRIFADLPKQFTELLEQSQTYVPHLNARSKIIKTLNGPDSPLKAAIERGSFLPQDKDWLTNFTPETWKKAIKKSGEGLPIPPVVDTAPKVLEQINDAFSSLAFNYRSWLSKHLTEAKERANVVSFNDLLHLLNRALRDDEEDRIAPLLSSRYDAALIDEFQDTDNVQFEIAQRLFAGGEHYLFFIGDPKQSIYRFRGADIYAYFHATKGDGLQQIHLDKNFRSAPGLVKAVNSLFSNSAAAFVDERISFRPVEAAQLELKPAFVSKFPFSINQLTLEEGAYAPGKGDYRRVLAERAANDFAQRLNEDSSAKAEDVTFLVNDRTEAAAIHDALLLRGISSSIRADRSVFTTPEAADLLQLLSAIASPARSSVKRGAYACLNRSIKAADMASEIFEEDAASFMEFIVEWAREWFEYNFNVAFNRLMQLCSNSNDAAYNLDNERRYANFTQLAELLSEARDAENLSPRGLINWLRNKETADVSQKEEWQTRISSDEGKPQILTVHKSKGLQFPIVILPFLGLKRIRLNQSSSTYHGNNDELIIDFAPDPEGDSFEHSRLETLAEDVRLLYVALTRAVFENIVYLSPEEISSHSKSLCSSFAKFVLGAGEEHSSEALATRLRQIADASEGTLKFEQSVYEAGDFIEIEQKAATISEVKVRERSLTNRQELPRAERVLSFSALNRSLHKDSKNAAVNLAESEFENDEAPVVEEAPELEEAPSDLPAEISIFTLPKGTHAGDLLHLILERFDFSQSENLAATTQEAFETLQFEPREFEPIVAAQIAAIAKKQLPSAFGSFRLEDVPPSKRIAELEFAYPVIGDTKRSIANALKSAPLGKIPKSWLEQFEHAESGLTASMLRGFIDLVLEQNGRLYIFDWKSNYLGDTPASYDEAAMQESMSDHNYYLQYLLYCVALKRYVAWRFPNDKFEERFGGVFYLYARGITPEADTGIYYDLPSTELLEKLDNSFA